MLVSRLEVVSSIVTPVTIDVTNTNTYQHEVFFMSDVA